MHVPSGHTDPCIQRMFTAFPSCGGTGNQARDSTHIGHGMTGADEPVLFIFLFLELFCQPVLFLGCLVTRLTSSQVLVGQLRDVWLSGLDT